MLVNRHHRWSDELTKYRLAHSGLEKTLGETLASGDGTLSAGPNGSAGPQIFLVASIARKEMKPCCEGRDRAIGPFGPRLSFHTEVVACSLVWSFGGSRQAAMEAMLSVSIVKAVPREILLFFKK